MTSGTDADIGTAHRLPVVLAPVLDALGLVIFVVIGRRQHHVHAGADELLTTLWPFLAGWFAVAVALRLYTSPPSWRRAIPTWIMGTALAIWLRIAFTDHVFMLSFALVAAAFIGFALLGWRLVLIAARSRH